MERIINGHYADPNSTRDITGITPEEFEVLISILQNQYKTIEMIYSLPEKERLNMIYQNLDVITDNDPDSELHALVGENVSDHITELLEVYATQHRVVYSFLQGINQPYDGAEYYKGD